jgi:predicted nucleic acid-binding protein
VKVLSDSSVLMALSVIGRLDLLRHKFGEIFVPEAVWQETVVDGKDKIGTNEIQRADWIYAMPIQNKLFAKALEKDVDYGESEAIVLAMETEADFLLLDDKLARAMAINFGLEIIGTVGILIWAKQEGLIQQLQIELDNLAKHANFRMSQGLINMALQKVGE